MNERATSVKEQAARMILGEIAPLIEKLDEVAAMQRDAHESVVADLQAFGALASSLERVMREGGEKFDYLTGQASMVQKTIARFEGAPAPKASAGLSPVMLAALVAGASFVSALLAAGAVLLVERSTMEQARVGRAVMQAYPQLDVPTRQRLDAAIQKAGQ